MSLPSLLHGLLRQLDTDYSKSLEIRPNMTLAALDLIFTMPTWPSCNLESTSALILVVMVSLYRRKIGPSSPCFSFWICQYRCSSKGTAAQWEGQPGNVYYHGFVRVVSSSVAVTLSWDMSSSVATLCIQYSPWPRAMANALVFITRHICPGESVSNIHARSCACTWSPACTASTCVA